jgi:hypothetical protein
MKPIKSYFVLLLFVLAASTWASRGMAREGADNNAAAVDVQVAEAAVDDAEVAAPELTMAEIIGLLRQQQEELAQQKQLLESQSREIAELTKVVKILKTQAPESGEQVVVQTAPTAPTTPQTAQSSDIPQLPEKVDDVASLAQSDEAEPEQTQAEEDIVAGEAVADAQTDDPTLALLDSFRGAWRLPGTNAALAIGGYVKTSVVYNNDPLEVKDRFIVGSIPVGERDGSNLQAQSSITALQSRLNFDLREATEFGALRAFIEGDFAGEGDQFRLRHAFGQWRSVLAGKTWSAFVDTQASPEEVDFEGLNGRINVRQSQVRFMPSIGANYEFQFSLEDPNPQIQNGAGITRTPDVVATGRFQPYDRLHLKLALLAREIRAQRSLESGGGVDSQFAWGVGLSGRLMTPKLEQRDSLVFQVNVGNGIGRYVNDLSSIGNFDGIFNSGNGDLELFDVYSGYVSWQHWWGFEKTRSNFTFGAVQVDNPGFVDDDAYKRTIRLSGNLFWSPTKRIDLGGELLWGERENENGDSANASQVQVSLRYRF